MRKYRSSANRTIEVKGLAMPKRRPTALALIDEGNNMICDHRDCGAKEKVWLPYNYKGLERGLKPHVFCIKCGLVKSSSSDKPRRLGYYINIVVALSEIVKITKVQMRLISIELEKNGIDDVYSMDKCCQEALFIEVVRRYVNIPEQIIRRCLSNYS